MRTGGAWSHIPTGARSAEDEAIRNIERPEKQEIPEHVYRNADEIRRYLELWPTFAEASLMGSDEPYDRKARGSSRLPTPEKGVLFMFEGEGLGVKADEESERALGYLRSAMRDLHDGPVRIGGVSFAEIASELWQDPSAARRWDVSRFPEGTKEERKKQTAFKKFALLLAWTLEAKFPEAEVTVGTDEQRARAKTRREYNRERRTGKEYALGVIGQEVAWIMESKDLGPEEAIRLYQELASKEDREPPGRRRCYEALAHVRGEDVEP
jgi:hypothetical protein